MDTLTIKTLRLIELCREAAAVGQLVITGHDNPDADSVISAVMMKRLMDRCGVSCRIKLPTRPDNVTLRDVSTLGIWDGSAVCQFDGDDALLLVDHHKTFYSNLVLACVDHHTTPPAPDCECAIVKKASSCGKIIFDMMRALGVDTPDDERLALYSVYLDTQSCRSSKFNKEDAVWAEECIAKYGIDKVGIERMGFCLNSPDEPVDVIAMYAFKRYEFHRVCASTAIQIDDDDAVWDGVIRQSVDLLRDKSAKEGYALWAFVVNKPMKTRSDIYFIYGDGNVQKLELDRLASRSKDVIPVVSTIK